jgi:hypothetical protein
MFHPVSLRDHMYYFPCSLVIVFGVLPSAQSRAFESQSSWKAIQNCADPDESEPATFWF